MNLIPASFDPSATATGPEGQRAHPATIDHSQRLEEKLYKLGSHAWTMVGNGLSNQSFVEGPEGLIVIDTGECIEEMNAALAAIRQETNAPIVACITPTFTMWAAPRPCSMNPATLTCRFTATAALMPT